MKKWLFAAALMPFCATAHTIGAAPQAPPEWWVILCLALALGMYVHGMMRLGRRARHGVRWREAAYFAGGWIALAVALVSPLDGAGALSFSAHMVQHELLMIVAAPLLVRGRPLGTWAWSVPRRWLRPFSGTGTGFWQLITRPLHAWLLHFASLWLWHIPYLFQASLLHPAVHAAQHASFLFPALLFWWAVLEKGAAHRPGAALAYLFTTMLHTSALGALFALSTRIWYPVYGMGATQYGLSPLEDQQLGGLIMWVPGGLAYVIAGLALCAGWLRESPQKAWS